MTTKKTPLKQLQNYDGSQPCSPSLRTHLLVWPPEFYEQDTVKVAKQLLGQYLVIDNQKGVKMALITETEAYPGITDRASHSFKGKTKRTSVLFGKAGHAYIYLIYGLYHCLNVVTDSPESGGAVLIRAAVPICGIIGSLKGPGLLCKALGINREYDGLPLTEKLLTIRRNLSQQKIRATLIEPRVGIDYAGPDKDKPYRFSLSDELISSMLKK